MDAWIARSHTSYLIARHVCCELQFTSSPSSSVEQYWYVVKSPRVVTARVFFVLGRFFYFHPQCQGRHLHLRGMRLAHPLMLRSSEINLFLSAGYGDRTRTAGVSGECANHYTTGSSLVVGVFVEVTGWTFYFMYIVCVEYDKSTFGGITLNPSTITMTYDYEWFILFVLYDIGDITNMHGPITTNSHKDCAVHTRSGSSNLFKKVVVKSSPQEFSWTWFCGIYKLWWLIHIYWPLLNQNQPSARLALMGNFVLREKQNGRQMLPGKLNNDYNFPNKALRELIMVSNYVFNIKEYNGTYF